MPSRETLDALASDEFLSGLAFGVAALAVGVVVVYLWRQWKKTPAAIGGLLLVVAAAGGLQRTAEPSSDLWVGLVLLALGGGLYPLVRRVPFLPAVVAIPGAWWIALDVELPGAAWVPWMVFGWIVVCAAVVAAFDVHFADRGYGPVLMAIAIAGMFTTLPDTEEVLVVLGVAVAVTVLAWPKPWVSLGSVGVYPMLGLLAWVIAQGGRGRHGSIVGAAACLGLLVVEPVVRRWRGATALEGTPITMRRLVVVAGFQLTFVLVAARVAGLSDSPLRAGLIVAAITLGAGAALLAIGPPVRSNAR